MNLPQPLITGRLLRRYRRFLADVELDDGSVVTAHTPNTGSMLQCAVPGHAVLLSRSADPRRKLAWSWELVQVNGHWVDINTQRANRVVEEALSQNVLAEFQDYNVRREYPFADSRIDFMLAKGDDKVLLEVKNVTLCCTPHQACFPDAVTIRGQKHLRDLMTAIDSGWRAALLFLVQRGEAESFAPADHIDPAYGRLLRQAARAGVAILACQTTVTPTESRISARLPVRLPDQSSQDC